MARERPKVITVTGGKGGTGKTVIASNLAALLSSAGLRILLIDLDVENPCAHTLLGASLKVVEKVAIFKPLINEKACTLCGECVSACPVHALAIVPSRKVLFLEALCESCAACLYVCPVGAISRGERIIGWIKEGRARSVDIVTGELKPGSRQYHEVMERTMDHARRVWRRYDIAVMDLPPGAGRGVYAALKLSDLALMVTEPTRLGLADLERLHNLAGKTGVKELVVLNKYGLPGGTAVSIEEFVSRERLKLVRVRYDPELARAYARGKLVVESPQSPSAQDIVKLMNVVADVLGLDAVKYM